MNLLNITKAVYQTPKRISFILASLILTTLMFVLPNSTNAQEIVPLLNPSFEDAGASAQDALNWQDFQGGYDRTNTAHSGSWGIKIQKSSAPGLSGAFQRIDLNQTTQKPVAIGGYLKGDNIKMASGSWFGASIYVEIHLKDGSVAYWNSLPNYGSFGWRPVGFNTGTVPTVNQPISHIFVVPMLGNATGTAYFDDLRIQQYTPNQSAVTIMFDDGESSTFTVGKPVLDKFKFPGTAAIVSSFVGDSGYMNRAQLKTLQTAGWEIVSHSISHDDMTQFGSARSLAEFAMSKQRLTSFGLTVKNFAFPFGAYNSALIYQGANYYRSLRAYETGANPQGASPYEVKVKGLLSTTTPEEVSSWVASAQQNKQWIVLVFHSLAASGEDQYHTDPAVFAKMIQNIANSGVSVVTYNEGLNRFAATPL